MSVQVTNQAKNEVERARLLADVHDFLSVLRGMSNELTPFDWVRHLAPDGEYQLGVQAIPVDHIIGSVDRYREFDRYYLPKEKHLDERWVGIRRANLRARSCRRSRSIKWASCTSSRTATTGSAWPAVRDSFTSTPA